MADKMRWRRGDTNPVVAAVRADTVIEIGDLVWQDVDNVKPASQLVDVMLHHAGEEIDLRTEFVKRFLGVAMQRSRAGEYDDLRVATTGAFEFDYDLYPLLIGQLIGPHVLPDPTRLLNQFVDTLCDHHLFAIGRCCKRAVNGGTVIFNIHSTIMLGGLPQ